MHIFAALILATSSTLFTLSLTSAQIVKPLRPEGLTISHLQDGEVDWDGSSFGYVEATVGNDFANPIYNDHTSECKKAGLLCGAFHLAVPNLSSGDEQAKYFVQNGGDWAPTDKNRLPGGLVVGYAYEETSCFGLTPKDMVQWLHAFSDEYYASTGRYPVIGTSYTWWKNCTKNNPTFNSTNALALLGPDRVPGKWGYWSFFQYEEPSNYPGSLVWYDTETSLNTFATGDY
ncbi:hypothetical protein FRC03_010072 [Tulasnella sp. 419]|nr:hypothetical protein FRC03_010072 [Tulasnella sp. 419]